MLEVREQVGRGGGGEEVRSSCGFEKPLMWRSNGDHAAKRGRALKRFKEWIELVAGCCPQTWQRAVRRRACIGVADIFRSENVLRPVLVGWGIEDPSSAS